MISRSPATVRTRQNLEQMAIRVDEVEASSALVVVDLAGTLLEGIGPVLECASADAREDRIEVVLVDQEGVVLGNDAKVARVEEVERGSVVELDDEKVPEGFGRRQAEKVGEKGGRRLLVAAMDDRVVEPNAHGLPPPDEKRASLRYSPGSGPEPGRPGFRGRSSVIVNHGALECTKMLARGVIPGSSSRLPMGTTATPRLSSSHGTLEPQRRQNTCMNRSASGGLYDCNWSSPSEKRRPSRATM